MPAIVQILMVFAAILVMNRLGVWLGLSLVLGAVAIDLWSGRGVAATLADLAEACLLPTMWLLILVVALILELGRFMAEERNAAVISALARRVGGRHGRALSVISLPAVIGLVPMPGGALFSAPLVAQAVPGSAWPEAWKAAVNYWFRHVWEYWWPLYPVVIVTLSIFDVETWQFMLALLPLSVMAFVSGILFLVRPHLGTLAEPAGTDTGPIRGAWALGAPLVLIVTASLALPPVVRAVAPAWTGSVHKLVAMLIGLAGALAAIARFERNEVHLRPFSALLQPKSIRILSALAGVMIFQTLLDRSGRIPVAAAELVASGIPPAVVVALLPLIAGLVTGIAIGFAGTAFPLIVGLASDPASGLHPMATLVLAFGFGYAGMMLSPIHLCFLLTRDYFTTSFSRVYVLIAPCILCLLGASLGLYGLFSILHW